MYWIVYLTTNKINGKIYIGVHKTSNLEVCDYLGCGVYINKKSSYNTPETHFQYAVKKYGPENFIRTTLKVFDNETDALDLEAWLVTEEFVKRPDTYNMERGGGRISKPLRSKAVHIYDYFGKYVTTCLSRSDAARFIYGTEIRVPLITRALHSEKICNNYQVSNIKYDFMKDYSLKNLEIYNNMCNKLLNNYTNSKVAQIAKPRKVQQFDLDGNLVKIWDSMNQCKKAGYTNVQAVAEGKREKCKGYIFKFLED